MPTILTCTDGSAYGPSIYEHSAWAALRLGTGIELLHVIEHHREHTQVIDLSGAIGMEARAELTEELTKLEKAQSRVARLKGKAMLEEARAKLREAGVAEVKITQRHGTLLETLEELEPTAELVVVGKRGEHGGATHSPLGENLENLVRISVRPVLVASRKFQPISRCMIAFDDSASARKAVEYVAASPLFQGIECDLIMVGYSDEAHEAALNGARKRLAEAGRVVSARLVRGNPGTVIAEELKKANDHLLVMGAYGHSKIREFFLGSTTTKLVRGCSAPVLMFR